MNTIKFVQKNLNYRKDAEELLSVFIRAEEISIALINEPYSTDLKDLFYDRSGEAAIGIFRPDLSIVDLEVGDGFVAATVAGCFRLYSCYAKSSLTVVEFKSFMNKLNASVAVYRETGMVVIIAGDFNAHSTVWDRQYRDIKGYFLRMLWNSLGMVMANRKSLPTFFPIELRPITPVTLVSNTAYRRLQGWRVWMNTENVNDHHHHYITFSLSDRASDSTSSIATGSHHQDVRHLIKTFKGISKWVGGETRFLDSPPFDEKEPVVKCNVATWNIAYLLRTHLRTKRKQPVWWNDEIATARIECFRMRRKWARARKLNNSEAIIIAVENDYRMVQRTFKHLIRTAKAKCYRNLIWITESDA